MDDDCVTEAMISFGGNFIQRLGRLYRSADSDNQARIKAAWPEYWAKYHDIAVKLWSESVSDERVDGSQRRS